MKEEDISPFSHICSAIHKHYGKIPAMIDLYDKKTRVFATWPRGPDKMHLEILDEKPQPMKKVTQKSSLDLTMISTSKSHEELKSCSSALELWKDIALALKMCQFDKRLEDGIKITLVSQAKGYTSRIGVLIKPVKDITNKRIKWILENDKKTFMQMEVNLNTLEGIFEKRTIANDLYSNSQKGALRKPPRVVLNPITPTHCQKQNTFKLSNIGNTKIYPEPSSVEAS